MRLLEIVDFYFRLYGLYFGLYAVFKSGGIERPQIPVFVGLEQFIALYAQQETRIKITANDNAVK